MGHCSSKISSLNDPKIISQIIDHDLYIDNLKDKLTYKLLILGLPGSGKTTLIEQFINCNFNDVTIKSCSQITSFRNSPKKKKRGLSISRLETDDAVTWNLINPENQSYNTKKWIDKFDNIQAVIYLINVEDYLNDKMKSQSNIEYFESIFVKGRFINKPIFIILNHKGIYSEDIIEQYTEKISGYKFYTFYANLLHLGDITKIFNNIRMLLLFRGEKEIRKSLKELQKYDAFANFEKTGIM